MQSVHVLQLIALATASYVHNILRIKPSGFERKLSVRGENKECCTFPKLLNCHSHSTAKCMHLNCRQIESTLLVITRWEERSARIGDRETN